MLPIRPDDAACQYRQVEIGDGCAGPHGRFRLLGLLGRNEAGAASRLGASRSSCGQSDSLPSIVWPATRPASKVCSIIRSMPCMTEEVESNPFLPSEQSSFLPNELSPRHRPYPHPDSTRGRIVHRSIRRPSQAGWRAFRNIGDQVG